MTFEEVLADVQKNTGNSYTAIHLCEDTNFLSVYTISTHEDDPDWVSTGYEGGYFFDSEGEEDSFSIDEIPKIVRKLHFKNTESLPFIMGNNSEYVMYQLFPNLPDPTDIISEQEAMTFLKSAKDAFNNNWT
jgi:hypothetical protein